MLGLFLGILLIASGYYLAAGRNLSKVHSDRSELTQHSTVENLIPNNLNSPEQWLAIRSGNVAAIQETLGLSNPQRCTWKDGFAISGVERLFISPPVNGWILVVGPALPAPEEDVDFCFHFISHISKRLGHVQFFSVNSALNHHCWVRAHTGRIERAYAWCGETQWNQGPVTPEESVIGMECHQYGISIEDLDPKQITQLNNNTVNIPQLAARWSINPDALSPEIFTKSSGITGELFPATSEPETD
ncbi:MAG TPA: hypothetical protein DEB48_07270 [Verrucomicrobiales bacterium]|nr:hypothetical protein [Verrucomicrobiales bacterium]